MRIHFDFDISWWKIKSYLSWKIKSAWESIRDRYSPLIRGPIEVKPEHFIDLLLEHRPCTMMAQWCHPNNWSEGKMFSFTFRARRTMYATYFYAEKERTGYLQDMIPEPLVPLVNSSSSMWPIRNPADRLKKAALRNSPPNTELTR